MYVFRLCDIVYHALQYMSYIIWFPNSNFRSNYCGGCNAVYVDDKGNEVDCGIAEFRRRNLRRSNDHKWNRSFISNIWITTAKDNHWPLFYLYSPYILVFTTFHNCGVSSYHVYIYWRYHMNYKLEIKWTFQLLNKYYMTNE